MFRQKGLISPGDYDRFFDFRRFIEAYYSRGTRVSFESLKGSWRYDYQLKGFLDIYTRCLHHATESGASLVVDLGAGECKYSFVFQDKGIKYVGIDFARGDPRWNYRGIDVVADITTLPLRDQCLDVVMLSAVLEHIKEPKTLLQEIGRTLKDKGKLFGIVTFVCEEHQQPYDYFRYTAYGLKHLLNQAGFRNHAVTYGNYDLVTYAYFARRFLNLYLRNRFVRKAYNLYFERVVNRRLNEVDSESTFPLFYSFVAKK